MKFNGADYITLKKLTLSATGSSFARVIELSNNSTHNNFFNNAIIGVVTTNASVDYSLVYSPYAANSLDSSNTFTSNYLLNGSTGLHLYGYNAPNLESGTIISGNTLLNQSSTGIYLSGHNAPVLIGNTISSNSAQATVSGIICSACNNALKIIKNKISLLSVTSGYAIHVNTCSGTASQYGIVANNFVSISATYRSVGIGCANSVYQKIYYNSVNVPGSSSGIAYYHDKSKNVFLKNNILAAERGYAIYVDYISSSFSAPASDYNDLYTTGTNIGYYDGSNKKDFVTWRNDLKSYGYDAHSISKKPGFNSSSDLHEHNITPFHYGTPLPEISDDIDKETRPASLTDIGADEVAPLKTDAGILTIKTPINCIGSYPMNISLYNYGSDTLKKVTINWKVNNELQTPFNWTGSLVDSTDINLGQYVFLRDSVYTLSFWTSLPNEQADMNASNDGTQTTIKTRMSGIYTIGGASPDYPTFKAAINELNNYGICDHVIFNVRPGTYTEQLLINSIVGTIATSKTITFQSENRDSTSVILQYASTTDAANYTLKFNYTGRIIFRNMTIAATGSSYGRVIEVARSYVTVSNNRIIGIPVTTVADTFALIYSVGNSTTYNGPGSSNVFDHNVLIDGSLGFNFKASSNIGDVSSGTSITNSSFQNQYFSGILLYSQFGYLIENNLFTSNSTYNQKSGIRCENSGSYYYFELLRIKGNKIIFTTASTGCYGIYLSSCDGKSNGAIYYYNIVSNNMISIKTASGILAMGIYTRDSDYLQYYNNSISITGNNTSSVAFANSNASSVYLRNNIFSNSAGGYALKGAGSSSDYNNFYTNGPYLAAYNYATASNVATLTDWQALLNQDRHSKSIKPQFASDSDLHENYITRLNYGMPLTEVPIDIDQEVRNAKIPDIGADEYSAFTMDAGLETIMTGDYICSGNKNILVRFINSGTTTLTNLRFNLKINSVLQSPYTWNGTLISGDSAVVNIGSYNFKQAIDNSISIWTDQPNGQTDLNALNDTLNRTVYTSLSGTLTIGGSSPDYATFNLAANDLKKYGVCGPLVFNVRPGTYAEQMTLPKITGASSVNTITFQSETADSTSAILTYASSIDSLNFTVRLRSSDFITFKKLTIAATGSKFARVIELANSNITALNCRIEGVSTASSGNYELVYSVSTSSFISCLFDACVFKNGSYGLYVNSTNTIRPVVTNNLFENQMIYGMSFNYVYNALIEKNTIISNTNVYQAYGIHCNGSCIISKNKIIFTNTMGASGILYGAWAACTISNNFIVIQSTTGNAYGINSSGDAYASTNVKIYNNSVNMIGFNSSSAAYYQNNKSKYTILVKNNIFSNNAGGVPISIAQSTGIVSDYNIPYSTKPFDLKSWQTFTSLDLHSQSIAPHFYSNTDLHENYITKFNLGTPLTEITDDIDGNPRPPLKLDIGADEVILPTEDPGVTMIKKIACEGTNTVYATVFNYGSSTLTNFTVNWKINNTIQPAYNWTGTLVSSDSITIPVGSYTFPSIVSYDFIAWTSNPNGKPDMNITNDTAKLMNSQAPLNGMYTIGTGSNFTNFSAAADYLTNYGICGPVTFNVAPGTYTEQFVLPKISGASAINTITYQPQSGDSTSVVLTFTATDSAKNYTVKLNGASYITFKKMIMAATGSKYAKVIYIGDYSSNNKFLNNQFIGVPTTSHSDEFVLIHSENLNGAATDSNNVFKFNLFKNGSIGINSIGSSWITNTPYVRRGTVISNNSFINQSYMGIFLDYQTNLKINENNIESNFQNYYGIFCANIANPLTIMKNKINASFGGIILAQCYNIDNVKPGLVANNFISLNATPNSEGIRTDGSTNQYIVFNTVNMRGNGPGSNAYLQTSSYGIILKNNILSNNATGYAICNDMSDGITSDYNDLYTNGSTLVQWHISTSFANLAAWKTGFGMDIHSVSVNPSFVSATDLHLYKDFAMNNKAIPFAEITDDIDGNKRSLTTPDIGADEFDITTDVNEFNHSSDITIYPNPATTKITIELSENNVAGTLFIYNVNGQELIKRQVFDRKNVIDISDLSNGIYFVMLRTEADVLAVKKIIKELP